LIPSDVELIQRAEASSIDRIAAVSKVFHVRDGRFDIGAGVAASDCDEQWR